MSSSAILMTRLDFFLRMRLSSLEPSMHTLSKQTSPQSSKLQTEIYKSLPMLSLSTTFLLPTKGKRRRLHWDFLFSCGLNTHFLLWNTELALLEPSCESASAISEFSFATKQHVSGVEAGVTFDDLEDLLHLPDFTQIEPLVFVFEIQLPVDKRQGLGVLLFWFFLLRRVICWFLTPRHFGSPKLLNLSYLESCSFMPISD